MIQYSTFRTSQCAYNVAESVFSSTATQGSSLKGVDVTGVYLHPRSWLLQVKIGSYSAWAELRPVCYVAFASVLGDTSTFASHVFWVQDAHLGKGRRLSLEPHLQRASREGARHIFRSCSDIPSLRMSSWRRFISLGRLGHHDVVRDLRVRACHNDECVVEPVLST